MGGKGFVVSDVPRGLVNISTTGDIRCVRCASCGKGGTGGVKAPIKDGGPLLGAFEVDCTEASVSDLSRPVPCPCPHIFPRNALVFARTDFFSFASPVPSDGFRNRGLAKTQSSLLPLSVYCVPPGSFPLTVCIDGEGAGAGTYFAEDVEDR